MNVDAEIRNSGGDDVKSEFYLVAPPPMRFVMIDKKWTNQTIFCYHSNIGASSLLRCDVSNELKVGSSAHLRAIFEVEPEEFENLIAFSASANGSNSEILGCSASNTVNETIPVRANASISALG